MDSDWNTANRSRSESFSTPQSPDTVTALAFLNSVPLYNPSLHSRGPRTRYDCDSIDYPPLLNSPPPPYPSHRNVAEEYPSTRTRVNQNYSGNVTQANHRTVLETTGGARSTSRSFVIERNELHNSLRGSRSNPVEKRGIPNSTWNSPASKPRGMGLEQPKPPKVLRQTIFQYPYSQPVRARSAEPYQSFNKTGPLPTYREGHNFNTQDSPTVPSLLSPGTPNTITATSSPVRVHTWPNAHSSTQPLAPGSSSTILSRPDLQHSLKPTTNWRQLSSLNLAHPRGLLIYLHSLELISKPLDTTGQKHKRRHASFSSPLSTGASPCIVLPTATYIPRQSPHSSNPTSSQSSQTSNIARLGLIPQPNSWLPIPVDVLISANLNRTSNEPPAPGIQAQTTCHYNDFSYTHAFSSCRTIILKRTRLITRDSTGNPLPTTLDEKMSNFQVKDISLELVPFGTVIGHPYNVFLNRTDGSVWILPSSSNIVQKQKLNLFDTWAFDVLRIHRYRRISGASEKVVAVRWANGLDCVDEMEVRGDSLLEGGRGGRIEIYVGEGIKEVEEEGWSEGMGEIWGHLINNGDY